MADFVTPGQGHRTGRRTRAGSHQTYGGWEPNVCSSCGRKLTLKDAAMCHYDHATGQATAICGDCLLKGAKPLASADASAGNTLTPG